MFPLLPYPSSFLPQLDSLDDFDFIDGSASPVHHAMTVTRPPSPSFSFDFSIISPPSPTLDRDSGSSLFPSHWSRSSSARDKRYNPIHATSSSYRTIPLPPNHRTIQSSKSMKCIIPRLWGALSSPTRKGRRKTNRWKSYALPSNVSYADLQPLDGEEGELIDEACYVDAYDAVPIPLPHSTGPFSIFSPFKQPTEFLPR
jgi:F-box and WD-40 domain protein 1/11